MRLLAIDTSTFVGTVAVVQDGQLLAEWSASVRASHGETLLPHLSRVVEHAGLKVEDLDLFAVGIGPGSFTGVRIGVATVKGLALATHKPIVGVTSLRTLARGCVGAAGLVVPLIDAHKGELYCAAYRQREDGELEELVAPFHALPAQAASHLRAQLGGERVTLCGDGLSRYGQAFSAPFGAPHGVAPSFCDVPRAVCLAHEALRALSREGPSDLSKLAPLYLRASDAKLPA